MAEPVLVIHGVGNPHPEPFRAVVARLQQVVGAEYDLIDVFWGNLGAGELGFEDTVPDVGAAEEEGVFAAAPAWPVPVDGPGPGAPTDVERAAIIAAAARPTELEATDPVLTAAILEQLQDTVYLRTMTSPDVLVATGELIADSGPLPGDEDVEEAVFGGVSSVVGGVMRRVDRLLGAAVGEALGRFNEAVRKQLVPAAAGFFGDVLAYEHHRGAIHRRIWETLDARAPGYGTPERPVNVVAHSLGGVIMFHAATTGETGRTLAIDRFVTLGSQSSLFHAIDPRESGLAAYTPGNPVPVRAIRSWTNLWEPLDPLAFIAGKVFVLEDASGTRTAPRDVEVRHVLDSGFFTHGSYWESEELVEAIRSSS